jgi:class 3 adenylate cyclase
MIDSKLMLIDKDSYTSSVLVENLFQRGFKNVKTVSNSIQLPKAIAECRPDVVILNYHYDEFDSLILCSTLKQMSPLSLVISIVSPGPALKTVQLWAKQTKSVDLVIEKPLSDERFFIMLEDLLKVKKSSRALETKTQLLANLVPEAALSAVENNFNNEAKMFEAAILFTDIRRSTELIREIPPREYFQLLNNLLSSQAKLIKQFEGSVIKYTGDGVMAVFKGMGRSYLAMRCALALAETGKNIKLSYGVGVAEGLVLAGLIGDSENDGQRLQYDVIGASVHLASRLCSLADAGEVITTKKLNTVTNFKNMTVREMGSVSIRGFSNEIDCIALNPSQLKI